MHPEDIKAAIRKRGETQAGIARRLGVSKTAVGYVIEGRTRSLRVAETIADITGRPLVELWPRIYGAAK